MSSDKKTTRTRRLSFQDAVDGDSLELQDILQNSDHQRHDHRKRRKDSLDLAYEEESSFSNGLSNGARRVSIDPSLDLESNLNDTHQLNGNGARRTSFQAASEASVTSNGRRKPSVATVTTNRVASAASLVKSKSRGIVTDVLGAPCCESTFSEEFKLWFLR